jgi:hypothetical protein
LNSSSAASRGELKFKVSDVSGIVEEIKLGATILTDEDGVKITIPNKHIVGEIIHNSEEKKIVEEISEFRNSAILQSTSGCAIGYPPIHILRYFTR